MSSPKLGAKVGLLGFLDAGIICCALNRVMSSKGGTDEAVLWGKDRSRNTSKDHTTWCPPIFQICKTVSTPKFNVSVASLY